MPDDYKAKLKSLRFSATKAAPKVTTDVHDSHTVSITESDNRQDIHVKLPTITRKLKGTVN